MAGAGTPELDFHQAMRDFRTMFPNLETDVIEAVLRSNNGDVDATIDQLLQMAMENTANPNETRKKRAVTNQSHVNLPRETVDPRSTNNVAGATASVRSRDRGGSFDDPYDGRHPQMGGPLDFIPDPPQLDGSALDQRLFHEPPPPYSAVVAAQNSIIVPRCATIDLPPRLIPRQIPTHEPVPRSFLSPRLARVAASRSQTSSSHPWAKSRYNAPLVGALPEDFLRLKINGKIFYPGAASNPGPRRTTHHSDTHHHHHNAHGGSRREAPAVQRKPKAAKQQPPSAGLGVFYPMTFSNSITNSSPSRQRKIKSIQEEEAQTARNTDLLKQSAAVKERLAENEWQRQVAEDPQLERFLEDERIALLLQDKEFMKSLRSDKDLFAALNSDSMSRKSKSGSKKQSTKASSSSSSGSQSARKSSTPASVFSSLKNTSSFKKLPLRGDFSTDPIAQGAMEADIFKQYRNASFKTTTEDSSSSGALEREADIRAIFDDPATVSSREAQIFSQYRNQNNPAINMGSRRSLTSNDDAAGSEHPMDPFETEEPFAPYTKVLPQGDELDPALSEKVKYMSQASRKKLALLARKFVKKRKGSKAILGSSDAHFSGQYLLENTDDDYQPVEPRYFGRESGYDQ